MAAPEPLAQTEEVQIFNEICSERRPMIPDWPRLAQLEWRLIRLVRQQPSNPVLRIALGAAQVMLGHRELALPTLEVAWALRSSSPVTVRCALALAFATIGRFDRAIPLVRELAADPEVLFDPFAIDNGALIALLAGDIDLLAELRRKGGSKGNINLAESILAALGDEIIPHLPAHQQIAQKIIQPHACSVYIRLVDDGFDTPTIAVYVPVSTVTKKERRNLENNLISSLYDYYERSGISPSRGANACGYQLLDIPRLESAGEIG